MIRVEEADLARIVGELEQAREHVTALQARCTELVLENRELKKLVCPSCGRLKRGDAIE